MAKTTNGKNGISNGHISHRQIRGPNGKFAKQLQTPMIQAAPAGGQPVMPFTSTFAALVQSVSGKRVLLNPDEAIRQSRINANKCRLDLAVKGPLEERFLPTVLAPWHIEPEDKNNAEQVEM